MKRKPIPNRGWPKQTFLRLDEAGRIVVKDGRTLEEYINDPRLMKRRKENMKEHLEWLVVPKKVAAFGYFPHVG